MMHTPDSKQGQGSKAGEAEEPHGTENTMIPPIIPSSPSAPDPKDEAQKVKHLGAMVGGITGVVISIFLLAMAWTPSSGTNSLRLLVRSVLIPVVLSFIGMEVGAWLYRQKTRSDETRRQDRVRDALTIGLGICGGICGVVFAFIVIDVQKEFGGVSSLAAIAGTAIVGTLGALLGGVFGYRIAS